MSVKQIIEQSKNQQLIDELHEVLQRDEEGLPNISVKITGIDHDFDSFCVPHIKRIIRIVYERQVSKLKR